MTYEQKFLKDFEDWITQQVMINEMAKLESEKVFQEFKDERAKEAVIRYDSRLNAYQFLQQKFDNYRQHRDFHDFPDDLFNTREY